MAEFRALTSRVRPRGRDINGLDFAGGDVDESIVRQLHRGAFVADAQGVVLLVGGPRTGKTHLAAAFDVEAIEKRLKRVPFFSSFMTERIGKKFPVRGTQRERTCSTILSVSTIPCADTRPWATSAPVEFERKMGFA